MLDFDLTYLKYTYSSNLEVRNNYIASSCASSKIMKNIDPTENLEFLTSRFDEYECFKRIRTRSNAN